MKKISKYRLILASKSPRRQQILKDAGFNFKVEAKSVDESYPVELAPEEVPAFLAQKKANAYSQLEDGALLITADTVVILNNTILEKPKSKREAIDMLQQLSGKTHTVITGVCLKTNHSICTFSDQTLVTFKELTIEEIEHYVGTYQPFDKAGAYGVQEFIGMIGVTKMEGSFYNVMGLPVHLVYEQLTKLN